MNGTHASFFSGVGGLDLGLERAGWRTVSFSEIDPYASTVLAEQWPGVPNLGDITEVARDEGARRREYAGARRPDAVDPNPGGREQRGDGADWRDAFLWTGGFPCQDLSVAGKRRGMVEGSRSNLAHAFLDLVERHRPPAIVLENVPGLLSSHGGRDMAVVLGRLVELGYGVAYRTLDARYFGVPQRRRRIFIVGLRGGPDDPSGRVAAERAAAVLAVGSRCERHPPTGVKAGSGPARGARGSAHEPELVGAIPAGQHGFPDGVQEFMQGHFRVVPSALRGSHPDGINRALAGEVADARDDTSDVNSVGPTADADRVRAADGLAGRVDDRQDLAGPLLAGTGRPGQRTTDLNTPFVIEPEWGQGGDLRGRAADAAPALTPTEFERSTDRGVRIANNSVVAFTQNQREEVRDLGDHAGTVKQPGSHEQTLLAFVKRRRAQTVDDDETWGDGDVMPTLNAFDVGDVRTTAAVVSPLRVGAATIAHGGPGDTVPLTIGGEGDDDPLLPLGLDSHRYRCCGNGVVADVSEWFGRRLLEALS